jgi:hypothetical protein
MLRFQKSVNPGIGVCKATTAASMLNKAIGSQAELSFLKSHQEEAVL